MDSMVKLHLFIKKWGMKMWTKLTWPQTVSNVGLLWPPTEISDFNFMNISEFTNFFHRKPRSQFFTTAHRVVVGLLSYVVTVCFSAISLNCEKPLLASSCLSVRLSAWKNSVLDRFSWNFLFDYSRFFKIWQEWMAIYVKTWVHL